MSSGLKDLLQCDSLFSDWTQGPISQKKLDLALVDLAGLAKTASLCDVQELQILSTALFSALSSQPTTSSLGNTGHSLFRQGYDLLMNMFDAVASKQVLPNVSELYLASLNALTNKITQQPKQNFGLTDYVCLLYTSPSPRDS